MGKRIKVHPDFLKFCESHCTEYSYHELAEIARERFNMPEANRCFIDNFFRAHNLRNRRCSRGKNQGAIAVKAIGSVKKRQYYKMIKVGRKWIPLHRYILKQAGYQLTTEDTVVWLDGNHMNCELDNLAVVSRATMLRAVKSGYLKTDNPKLSKAGLLLSELRGKIKEKTLNR